MTTVLFALVHYRNAGAIRLAIRAIRALPFKVDWRLDVIVADNSGDAPDDLGAEVVREGGNLGYLGGAAYALERWRASHGCMPNWFVLTNPDAVLRTNALLVLADLELDDDVAMVAPSVLLEGTTPQNPFLADRPSRARMRFYTIAFRSAVLTRALDATLRLKRRLARTRGIDGQTGRTIYAAHGSLVFIRSRFFEQGGTLAYRGFMYGEEIHLAEQARGLGLRIVFAPAIEVVHHGGSTTGRVDAARRRGWHRASADVLWEEYFR